ncbi:hypothetical protein [Solibaculum intestinale]|uniref:Uncharacterized protein n=1 Tax=Solibaculum intestinale TaxID=3133165 RepID=A0ABV1DYN1_9FIRM
MKGTWKKRYLTAPKKKTDSFSAAALFLGIAAVFYSTVFSFFAFQFPYFNNYSSKTAPVGRRVRFFFVGKYGFLRFHSGRSPPYSLSFLKNSD